jgi:hypothetical protein
MKKIEEALAVPQSQSTELSVSPFDAQAPTSPDKSKKVNLKEQ